MKRRNKSNKKVTFILKKILVTPFRFLIHLPEEMKRYLLGVLLIFLSVFFLLSIFQKGGVLGERLLSLSISFWGNYTTKIFYPFFSFWQELLIFGANTRISLSPFSFLFF
jgi:hypothetical protein